MIIQSGIRKIKRQNINLNSQTLHNCDTAYYVLSGAPDNTYSRVAGVLGAMSLTGLFICVVFWVQYALFNDKPLDPLSELWPLFTVGCALFAPYAFNRASQIGK